MYLESNKHSWRPTAKLSALQARAMFYQQIREFFAARGVLEIETPLLCARAVTDPYIQAFAAGGKYLQTSPEYAMKRLLAAGSGPIYQICKVFREEEIGSLHNTEFTMLEWYRPGFDHHQLMDEVDALMQLLFSTNQPARRISYQNLFKETVDINPHTIELGSVQLCAAKHGINLSAAAMDALTITDWLQLLMSHVIEPQLMGPVPWLVYDFPIAQSALAKIIQADYPVAARFEVYMQGIELANAYHELQDPFEQEKRFAADIAKRVQQNLKIMQADERLLAALEVGLPECAGIAMGLDRVLMLKLGAKSISEVLSFTNENA